MELTRQTRDDATLREEVMDRIRSNSAIAFRDILSNADDHIVTLAGFVATYSEKYAAEMAAQSIRGVEAVANDIVVKPLDGRTDPEIARDIVCAMRSDAGIPDNKIKVAVTDGIVRLSGRLERDVQRRTAETCVRNITGVTGILNTLTLEGRPGQALIDVLQTTAEMRQMPQAG